MLRDYNLYPFLWVDFPELLVFPYVVFFLLKQVVEMFLKNQIWSFRNT